MMILPAAIGAVLRPASSGAEVDPYWDQVVSLLHMDGFDQSTSFPDEKAVVWTAFGQAQVDRSQSKFGNGSLLLDGAGDYLRAEHNPIFSADDLFTFECWIRPTALSGVQAIASKRRSSGGSREWSFKIDVNVLNLSCWNTSSGVFVNLVGVTPLVAGEWHHVAFVANGSEWYLFLDGALEDTELTSGTYGAATEPMYIGREAFDTGRDFEGHIDDVRVTKGVARYTGPFIPPNAAFYSPPPTDPLYSEVSALLNCEEDDGSSVFVDEMGNTWAGSGNAQINEGQILLDGIGDWVRTSDQDPFIFGSEDFCIELFANPNSVAAEVGLITKWQGPNSNQAWFLGTRPSGRLFFLFTVSGAYEASRDIQSATGVVAAGVLHHVAVDRSGPSLKGFVNGVEVFSAAIGADSIFPSTLSTTIGAGATNLNINAGQFGPIRVTKASRYQSAFEPPIAPFPTVSPEPPSTDEYLSNVVSLLNFETDISDFTGKTWTANGDASVVDGALVLDGSGDYLSTPYHADFDFGTGDFTVELWQDWAGGKIMTQFDFRGGAASSPRPMLYNGTSSPYTELRFYLNGADRISASSGTQQVAAAQHIALSRVAGTTRLFADGVQVGSEYADATNYTNSGILLGRNSATTSRDFNGKILGWRVTKGIGRYASTFTPPVAPFPTVSPA